MFSDESLAGGRRPATLHPGRSPGPTRSLVAWPPAAQALALALSSLLPPRRDANVTHNSTIHHTMAHAGTCTRAILTFHALALTFRSCARARHDEMLSLSRSISLRLTHSSSQTCRACDSGEGARAPILLLLAMCRRHAASTAASRTSRTGAAGRSSGGTAQYCR